eukprot:CAMPEP_0118951406 /NCGR_PEP_ID=MMETSP1169-20130426/53052_1 /TAXON_ID=36882 /ORGANISM="Pyramimonas obovata, Strain CCMP722" /LENGTH=207 /DNA_ID=CAMNT_0006898455 /DNA_START=9 /DNA_END=632 /DNA_ORIENTATION=-
MTRAIVDVNKTRNDRLGRFFDDYTYSGGTYGNRLHHLPPTYRDRNSEIRQLDRSVPGLGPNSSWMVGGRAISSLNGLSMSAIDPGLWGPAPVAPSIDLRSAEGPPSYRGSQVSSSLPSLRNPSETQERNMLDRFCTPNPRPYHRLRSKYSEQHNSAWTRRMVPHLKHMNPRKYRNSHCQLIDIHKLGRRVAPKGPGATGTTDGQASV